MNNSRAGFTLLEMMVSMAILTIVSLLTFVALQSSTRSNMLNAAKEQVAADLRETLLAINSEVRQAYTTRTVDAEPPIAPEDAFAVTVTNSGKGLRFCVPQPGTTSPIPVSSTPIELIFQNEDGTVNAVLDDGEDANTDGALTRRIVRRQDGNDRVLGAANNISDITFAVTKSSAQHSTAMNTLTVTISGSKAIEAGGEKFLVESQVASTINIEN